MSAEEWESLMCRLCSILNIRNIVEQPVNSRFFRHPDMAVFLIAYKVAASVSLEICPSVLSVYSRLRW